MSIPILSSPSNQEQIVQSPLSHSVRRRWTLHQAPTFTITRRRLYPSNNCQVEVHHRVRSHEYLLSNPSRQKFYEVLWSRHPFRGVRVYTRSAMGMPGSETALEELMCRVLGNCLKDGIAAKLADDLYCGADSPEDLLVNWTRILDALRKSNIKLSPSKTIICPCSIITLGWIWTQGQLSASPHRVATLSSCPPPDTVRGLPPFIGAYKVLSRVLPQCAQTIAPLETSITGLQSRDKINWSDTLLQQFQLAQTSLSNRKSITLPKPPDKPWIIIDGPSPNEVLALLYTYRATKLPAFSVPS